MVRVNFFVIVRFLLFFFGSAKWLDIKTFNKFIKNKLKIRYGNINDFSISEFFARNNNYAKLEYRIEKGNESPNLSVKHRSIERINDG